MTVQRTGKVVTVYTQDRREDGKRGNVRGKVWQGADLVEVQAAGGRGLVLPGYTFATTLEADTSPR